MDQERLTVPSIPLGEVIAERRFTLYDRSGAGRQVIVSIGKPIPAGWDLGGVQCPFSISGLDRDEKVSAPIGNDAVDALQNAIWVAGQMLDQSVQRLDLINPFHEVRERHHPGEKHFVAPSYPDWLFRYDCQPGLDYGLVRKTEGK